MTTRPRLIITADDFGRDWPCTTAIAEQLVKGHITATSIMANAQCFEEACALARVRGLTNRIGVHLTLDEGPALSPEMAPYTDTRGHLQIRRSLVPFGPGKARAVEAELAAQIEKVLAAGIRPTHLDSHRHIHTAFPIGRIVARLAQRYRVPYVRPARDMVARGGAPGRAYKWMFNRYLAARVTTADHFGDIVDFVQRTGSARVAGLVECMTHLDDSARGLENRRVLESRAFRDRVADYELIGHAEACA